MHCNICKKVKPWSKFSVRLVHNKYKGCDKCFKRCEEFQDRIKMLETSKVKLSNTDKKTKPKLQPLIKPPIQYKRSGVFTESDEDRLARWDRVIQSYEKSKDMN